MRVYSPEPAGTAQPVPGFVRRYGLLSEEVEEGDWTVDWNGRRLVCPRHLRLRVLESTVAFASAYAGFGAGLIPDDSAMAADRELQQYQMEHPEHRSHVLTSAWHVPVRWFSAFRADDRELYEKGGRVRARFRVDMVEARRRVGDVLEVLQTLEVFDGPAAEQTQLLGWLGQFPDDSMLELDYGDVSELFDVQDLALDDSVELIQASVEALADGDMMRAGESYGRVVARWSHAYALTFSS